jgi:hypothetical protein
MFLLAHLPFQTHLDFEPVRLPDTVGCRFHSEMPKGNRWWGTLDQLPARAMIVPVICTSETTHMTNFLSNQPAWPLYLMICNI